jgi:ribulose-5-phosphate 4-epimerase/fuculose-1-phosphate aldolase
MSELSALLDDLVVANRILACEGVVDAFGHVSLRHPQDSGRYFLSRSRSPALVTRDDLIEFTLDGAPAAATGHALYAERAIHGALYRARADVQAVVHNHSEAVIPFSVTGTALRPLLHVAGGIGSDIPVWDIRARFGDTDMLVTTMEEGADLAATLGRGRVALMRGHGCAVVGGSLREAVMTAVYLQVNARLQMAAMALGPVTYLSAGEADLCAEMTRAPLVTDRVWEYFRGRALAA